MRFRNGILISCISAFAGIAIADTITLTSGRVVQGTIIQTNENEVLVLADYGTTTLPANIIQQVTPDKDKHPTTLSTNTVSGEGRIPEWKTIIGKLASQAWADKLRQIPATVITNGILRNVPYISFRCGIDYEINIYGDLDNPAGVEVGMYRSLLSKAYAKENAVNFMASLLPKEPDQRAVRNLNREKDLQSHDGLSLEITPETGEDSYGGWWISAYDSKALEQARVSDKELENISVLNSAVIKPVASASAASGWTKDDLRYARASATTASPPSIPYQDSQSTSGGSMYPDVAPEHNHGSVYVHSYYRKDGTFVSSYTRRR